MVVDEVSVGPLGRGDDDPIPPPTASQDIAMFVGSHLSDEQARTVERAGYQTVRIRNDVDLQKVFDRVRVGDSEQVHLAVVESIESVDKILRPWPDREQGIIRPRGTILLADVGQGRAGLLAPIRERGIKISTSRCGDFRKALPVMERLVEEGANLGALLTDTLPAGHLPQAFERAQSPDSVKVVVVH
jgi:hypothetical protein